MGILGPLSLPRDFC